MEFNENLQEARSQRPLLSVCSSGRSEIKMAALASYWLRHFLTSLKRLNGFQQNVTGNKISTCPTKFVFIRSNGKQDGRPGQFVKKVAHYIRVHDMLPFESLVLALLVKG